MEKLVELARAVIKEYEQSVGNDGPSYGLYELAEAALAQYGTNPPTDRDERVTHES
jgi:hypothetical protein